MTFPAFRVERRGDSSRHRPRQKCRGRWGASLLLVAILSGCSGEAPPPKYEVTGKITYDGKPVVYGDIFLEPKQGLVNFQSVTKSMINDGQYRAEIVGGPHTVTVRDLTGDMEMDPTHFGKAKPILRKPYHGTVDFPPLDKASEDSLVEHNIEIPKVYR